MGGSALLLEMVFLGTVFLETVLLGCGSAGSEALDERGEFRVGYRILEVEFERRDGEGRRRLDAHVFYPTDAQEAPRDLLFRTASIARDALPKAGDFPVIAFSHGHQGIALGSSELFEHWASHGFVVLAPTHVGNTATDGPNRETWIYHQRAEDMSRSLDALETAPEFAAALGSGRLIAGHSFGGYTAYALAGARFDVAAIEAGCAAGDLRESVCGGLDAQALGIFEDGLRDARFDGVMALAPGDADLLGAGVMEISLPILHIVAELDGHAPGAPEEDPYFAAFPLGAKRIWLAGAGHNSLIDVCPLSGLRCAEGHDDAEDRRIVRMLGLAFARQVLAGERNAEALISEIAAQEPRVEFSERD